MISNFLFHRVSPERDPLWDPMDPALFDKCIAYISRNFKVVLFEDLVSQPELNSSKKIATIMFDDGYKDNIEYAAPILAKYNCKASFYIVTDCIEKNIPTWTHILEHTFQHTNTKQIDLNFNFLPLNLHINNLENKAERLAYIKKLKPFLKTLPHEQRNIVINRVVETFSDVNLPRIMMDWQDIIQLSNAGHYIESHTVSHCMLGTMTNENEITDELTVSGQMIKKHLGYFPKTISYPVGSYNQTTIKLSKAAGYTIGLAVGQKQYNPAVNGIFEIPRIELYNESWFKTKLRITNLLENIKTFVKYK